MSAELIGATGLAGRYATALFELAEDDKLLDRVTDDLGQLGRMIENSADLARLIRSPVISREDQGRAIAAIAQKMGLTGTTTNVLGLMASKRRLFVLPQMLRALDEKLAEARGEVTADVTTAKALNDKQKTRLPKAAKAATKKSQAWLCWFMHSGMLH